jgi:hypothetical protein
MEESRYCKTCGSGPVKRAIDGWGPRGDDVYLTCRCGREIWDARPLSCSEEGTWPDLLEGEISPAVRTGDVDQRLPLPYLRTVVAKPETVPLARALLLRVVLPTLVACLLVAMNVWLVNHWKPVSTLTVVVSEWLNQLKPFSTLV